MRRERGGISLVALTSGELTTIELGVWALFGLAKKEITRQVWCRLRGVSIAQQPQQLGGTLTLPVFRYHVDRI